MTQATDQPRQDAYLAPSSTIKQLTSTLLAFWLLHYHRSEMILARPHWRLAAVLVGTTA